MVAYINWNRRIADFLTGLRLVIAGFILFLGFSFGAEALASVSLLFLIGWTTDSLDGYFARRDYSRYRSWLSEHDRLVDTIMILSGWIYLAVSGYITQWIALLYPLGATAIIYKFPSKAVLSIVEVIPVLRIPMVTLAQHPLLGYLWIIWAIGAVILNRRCLKVRLTYLWNDFRNLKKRKINELFKS
ncbi:MAG: CDP-alcohol phosphatidyltransferase family protein [Candidatus Aminicenantia bacterium]